MNRTRLTWVVGIIGMIAAVARGEPAAPLSALARMPVREVTVFKDGHAFVLHSGTMPTDSSGDVVMDYLPVPVLGTFWPYSRDKNARLTAVVASQRRTLVERTALTVRELLESNAGAEAFIEESQGRSYFATIIGVPVRSADEQERTSPPGSGQQLPKKGDVILLKTAEGTRVVNLDQIQRVTFKGEHKGMAGCEELRNLLTLKLTWGGGAPQPTADVGMIYLQRGIRWIPNYKITIDGQGSATIKLQATLINELTDLSDVTAHLVIGVPTFAFAGSADPISLQAAAAQLSQYFEQNAQTAYGFSNAIMAQAAAPPSEYREDASGRARGRSAIDLGPEVAGAQSSEDLFVFRVDHVTLKRGQRMVVPVTEFTLKYNDVFTLDIPFSPPPEVCTQFSGTQQEQVARWMQMPKVMHTLRFKNDSAYPLTTAPALVLRDERVLAQGMLTYAAAGTECDLAVTAAVDVPMKKSDRETKRTPNAVKWNGNEYGRIDLSGTLTLTNRHGRAIDLEVTRSVLGNVGEADHDGKSEMVNVFEDFSFAAAGRPPWWNWYNWPYWWHHFNGVGRITWKLRLKADERVDLNYSWHYFWQ